MNWLLMIVLIILLLFGIWGWRRGFLKILYSLISIVLLIVLVSHATPHISNFVKEHTGIYRAIQERCIESVQQRAETEIEDAVDKNASSRTALPDKLSAYIMDTGENALAGSGLYEAIGSKAADWILAVAAFFLALIIAVIIVNMIGKALDIVNRIPVIKGINRAIGLFAGLFLAFIVISLFFLLLTLFATTEAGEACIRYIDGNPLLEQLYYHNILVEIFSFFIGQK